MQLFYAPQVGEGNLFLDEIDSKHCIQVMRHKIGDLLILADGQGTFFEAQITNANPKKCTFSILRSWLDDALPTSKLHIAIAPPKNTARFEWFLEKATEIGINEITPIITKRTERQVLKADRMQKILIAAMKQTLKAQVPLLHNVTKFETFIQTMAANTTYQARFIPHIDRKNELLKKRYVPHSHVLVLIGPEGDFTPDELQLARQNDFLPVSLGNSILRVETAGIFVCSLVQIANQSK